MVDIYTLLKRDHDLLRTLLADLAGGDQDPFERMAFELKVHSDAEEKTLYKWLEDRDGTRELVADGYRQHKEVERLSQELMTARGGSGDGFASLAEELRRTMERHMQAEENELFEKARLLLSPEEAVALGYRYGRCRWAMEQGAILV